MARQRERGLPARRNPPVQDKITEPFGWTLMKKPNKFNWLINHYSNNSKFHYTTIFTHHFSGAGIATGPVCMSGMLVHLHITQVKSEGQSHRSKFKIMGGKQELCNCRELDGQLQLETVKKVTAS